MEYTLTCDCDSQDFTYNEDKFTCNECGNKYHEESAGQHLLEYNPETGSTKVGDVLLRYGKKVRVIALVQGSDDVVVRFLDDENKHSRCYIYNVADLARVFDKTYVVTVYDKDEQVVGKREFADEPDRDLIWGCVHTFKGGHSATTTIKWGSM